MITWKEEYLWRRFSDEKKRKQIIKRILIWIALAAVLFLIVAISIDAFAEENTEEPTEMDTKVVVLKEEPVIIIEDQNMLLEEPTEEQEPMFDEEESYLLAKIAMAEAEGESIEGKAMVIKVVLNRVNTKGFPDSIEEVIFQCNKKKDVYQFSPIMPGGRWWRVEPNEECYEALKMITEEGWDESEGALYFEATYNGENTWHSNNLEYIKTVGNHKFYK